MRLTIVPIDGVVYVDGVSYSGLDLSFVPADVHALQWYATYGELEFKRLFVDGQLFHPENQMLTELPAWANTAKFAWDAAKIAEEARLAVEQAAEEARLAEVARLLAEQEALANTTTQVG
jgi:hypothetical protein